MLHFINKLTSRSIVGQWKLASSKTASSICWLLTTILVILFDMVDLASGRNVRQLKLKPNIFRYEEESRENFTVVSGATRYMQTGAVMFLPFRKRARAEEERLLGLDDEPFRLLGYQLGSGFGYSVEVLDLNKDG